MRRNWIGEARRKACENVKQASRLRSDGKRKPEARATYVTERGKSSVCTDPLPQCRERSPPRPRTFQVSTGSRRGEVYLEPVCRKDNRLWRLWFEQPVAAERLRYPAEPKYRAGRGHLD